jgi:hypothetical protein
VLRAAGETETMKGNIQEWIWLGEGDLGLQLMIKEETAPAIFLFTCFHQHCLYY